MSLFVGTDMKVEVTGLADQDGNPVTGASVKATVFEADGETKVTGVTWPVTLGDDDGGDYSGIIDGALGVSVDKLYWVLVETSGSGASAQWWQREVAKRRGFDA